MATEYLIFDLQSQRYYASFPDYYSSEVSDAVSFDSEEEAANRIKEVIKLGQMLIVIKYYWLKNG